MDSITSKNKDTRDYFFPVFRKIVDKSDGALAEVVGSYVLEYVKKYPKELADRFKCYSTSQLCRYEFKRLALYAGEEIMMRNERQKEYDELINHMTKNYKDWRKDKKLTIFIETVDDTRQKWTD
jgi:hypothetical protein